MCYTVVSSPVSYQCHSYYFYTLPIHVLWIIIILIVNISLVSYTGKDLASAPGNGQQVLHQVLTVGSLAAATFAEQNDGLVLPRGQKVPVGRLSHGIDMRCRVLTPAAFKHVHHLKNHE